MYVSLITVVYGRALMRTETLGCLIEMLTVLPGRCTDGLTVCASPAPLDAARRSTRTVPWPNPV